MDLDERIQQVEQRVNEACRRSGRARNDVRIIAVTKYVSLQTIQQLLQRGLKDIGENRWQDAREKWEQVGSQANWHFLGHLQSNKVKDIVGKFNTIHSIDRLSILQAIDRRASALGLTMNGFIQVNVSGEATKSGIEPDKLEAFSEQLKLYSSVRIMGLMTMAPYEAEPEQTRPVFRKLRELRDLLNEKSVLPYRIEHLSMGMSNDFEVAIEEGATWIRLGTVLAGREGG